jgi:hypothetical protein
VNSQEKSPDKYHFFRKASKNALISNDKINNNDNNSERVSLD